MEHLLWLLLNWPCIQIYAYKINICCGSRCTNKLNSNSEVKNWFNEHSYMTVVRLILV